jgi:hypothetical protein
VSIGCLVGGAHRAVWELQGTVRDPFPLLEIKLSIVLCLFHSFMAIPAVHMQNDLFLHKQTPYPESASELYEPSEPRLPAKFVQTLADRGMSRSQRGGSPTAVVSVL